MITKQCENMTILDKYFEIFSKNQFSAAIMIEARQPPPGGRKHMVIYAGLLHAVLSHTLPILS